MKFDPHANLKYKYGNRKFWCRGYYVDAIGGKQKKMEAYIRNQLTEDKQQDQLSLFEEVDSFTRQSNRKNKK